MHITNAYKLYEDLRPFILEYFILASLMQFLVECLIIVAGALWTRDLLPSDEYDSFWVAMVYKLTYVSTRL